MYTVLLILQVLLGIGIVILVLLQHGKGADAGAAFGSGASATVFGAQGSANFLSRTTAVLATLFFINSIALSNKYVIGSPQKASSVVENAQPLEESVSPAGHAAPADVPEAETSSGPGEASSQAEQDLPPVEVAPGETTENAAVTGENAGEGVSSGEKPSQPRGETAD